VDSYRSTDVQRVLSPLKQLAREVNCAVLVVRHFRKSGGAAKDRGAGSVAYRNTSRSQLIVALDPNDETATRRIITQEKMNLAPNLKEGLVYTLDENCYPPFTWCGTCRVKDSDILTDPAKAERAREETAVRNQAIDVLLDILRGGEADCAEVVKEAVQFGVSRSTVYRAARELGVLTKRVGFGKGSVWYIPPARLTKLLRERGRGRDEQEGGDSDGY
jgi:hypothetical protein